VDAVAADEAWLESTLAPAAAHDEFTGRLLALLVSSREQRARWADRAVVLGVHRSDYMLDAPSGGFLQVAKPSKAQQHLPCDVGAAETATLQMPPSCHTYSGV